MVEVIGRIMMLLTGFILVMLGTITFIHSDHQILGVLICGAGVTTMFAGIPNNERD